MFLDTRSWQFLRFDTANRADSSRLRLKTDSKEEYVSYVGFSFDGALLMMGCKSHKSSSKDVKAEKCVFYDVVNTHFSFSYFNIYEVTFSKLLTINELKWHSRACMSENFLVSNEKDKQYGWIKCQTFPQASV